LQHLFLSLPPICPKNSDTTHTAHGLPPWWKGQRRQALWVALGRLHRAHPSHPTPSPWLDRGKVALSLPALYKYPLTRGWSGGREDKRGNERKEKKRDRNEIKEKNRNERENREGWRDEKKRKNRGQKKRNKRVGRA
jgi:hypothetical protein